MTLVAVSAMEPLTAAFSHVCGQAAAHTWAPGGEALPVCQRCLGLYCGAVAALLLMLLVRPNPGFLLRWLFSLFLLQMVPFGFHWVEQGPLTRTVTGYLFGAGLFGLLWYATRGEAEVSGKDHRWRQAWFVGGLLAGLAALLWRASCGGQWDAAGLTGLAVLGFAALAVQSGWSATVGVRWAGRRMFARRQGAR
jgi:uncharacterized membrane protein